MNEQKNIRKSLIKNMFINFIAFTIIFSIFDLIIYNQISMSLYKSVDSELEIAKEQYVRQYKRKSNSNVDTSTQSNDSNNFDNIENISKLPQSTNENKQFLDKKLNPRLITIIRNKNGEITNQDSIGRLYEEYIFNIGFNENLIDQIYPISINNEYNYRAINLKVINENGKSIYIQLLINVDGETKTVENIFTTLLIGTSIIIVLSIIASYILSKKTIKPIVRSWKKQTEFVQNASHELRTPLTIIQAKQELLLQEPNKKIIDKSEDINLALKETRRLSKLIKELMVLARSDSDNYELKKEDTNIDKLIKEVIAPYIDFAQMQEKKITLDLKYKKQIKIDREKFNQLLIIILDNAIKYTSENETINVATYQKDGKFILEIADTGIGISDEALSHIFDRFYREDKARSRQTGGNGLGLSIAKTIVDAHNGNIKIVHNNPKGTKIIIKL